MSAYLDELRRQTSEVLDRLPTTFEWRDNRLVFPATEPDGFEVSLVSSEIDIVVTTNVGFHEHFESEPALAVRKGLGLARDLLSPDMRIRERLAGGRGYRWIAECLTPDGWVVDSSTGLLFWNYFGRRRERVYQNNQLSGRLNRA